MSKKAKIRKQKAETKSEAFSPDQLGTANREPGTPSQEPGTANQEPALPVSPPLLHSSTPPPSPPGPHVSAAPPASLNLDPELYQDEEHFDPAAQQLARDRSFGARFSFANQPLQKFSFSRRRLFLDMRAAAGAGPIGRIDGMFGDALRCIWLCLQDGEALESMKAGLGLPGSSTLPLLHRFQIAVDRWADANEDMLNPKQTELVDTFTEIWLDSQRGQAIHESAANRDPDDRTAGN